MVELVKQNYEENKKIYINTLEKLRQKLDNNIPIEQVGSTAIPNMYGKNIIDILIGAKDDLEFQLIKNTLEEMGFISSQKSRDNIYQFLSSKKEETASGDIHIHLAIKETLRYSEFIILKNYLLSNPEEAKKYSDFKKEIIKMGNTDRKEYKKIKSEYVTQLLERAKK